VTRTTRPVSWVAAARKAFESFPDGAQSICRAGLTIAAEGGKSDIAKPLKGLGSGVFEIAVRYRGNAFRLVYAVQLGADIWVVHAFQKKSTQGIKTRKHDIDLVKVRIRGLKEMLG
jgi:phage-related protein